MTNSMTITCDCDGRTCEVLSDLIAKREKYLKNETTENAVVATAINIITSLKSETKKAPLRAKPSMYTITQVGGVGWRGRKGMRRRVPTKGGKTINGIFPVNLMYGLKGDGITYKISLTNPNIRPKSKSGLKNAPDYYVMAPNMSVAQNFANRVVGRALSKESGMARYALGIAQAKASNREMTSGGPSGSRQMRVAYDAAHVTTFGGDGSFSINVNDELDYSIPALRAGKAALDLAMKRAANRTAAIINKMADYKFDEPIPTPFPEAKR